MTTDEIRKLADHWASLTYGGNSANDANTTLAAALRHYADSLDKRDKVEAMIQAGEKMRDIHFLEGKSYLFRPWDAAVAEYRKAQP